ncbi:hypothetical protein N9L76_07825 [bacterium]|nr:hypothetical protein [bacterium]
MFVRDATARACDAELPGGATVCTSRPSSRDDMRFRSNLPGVDGADARGVVPGKEVMKRRG